MSSRRPISWFLCGLIAIVPATPVLAGLPSPDDSQVPCGINLVGIRGGVPDPRGEFTIVSRDLAQNPIAGSEIVIDFCDCVGSTGFCLGDDQPDPDVVEVSPDGCRVRGTTDGSGTLRLSLVGHAFAGPASPYCPPKIYGDGANFVIDRPPIIVGAFDLDGAQGVAPPDISHWLDDSFASEYHARADYDCSRTVSPPDLAKLLDVSLGGGSLSSATGSYCH